MKEIHYSSQYKKDIKRYSHRQDLLNALYDLVRLLEQGLPIPFSYYPHKLKGFYKGCWECHIQNDFLLIWIDESTDEIKLLRLGTHSELFR